MSKAPIIDIDQSKKIVGAMAKAVTEQQSHLSKLDSTVGDGDHGINMATALQAASRQVLALENPTLEIVWRTTGKAIQNSVGGASGLLFGAFFIGAGRTLKEKETITLVDVAEMLAAGLVAVQKRGKAQSGDKTMVDALAPAVTTAQMMLAQGTPLIESLQGIADAAHQGATSTQQMVARHGRAKFLGERSRGFQDAGATSMAIMLTAWAEAIG